jgi:hypothetical protein
MRSAPADLSRASWPGRQWLPPVKPNVAMPAAFAAVTPGALSSMAIDHPGEEPIFSAA